MLKPLKIGVIQFPGSNCYEDTLKFFRNNGHLPMEIWHKESQINFSIDLLVLPGGFAFGDRIYRKATEEYEIEPGTMALKSPVMDIVRNFVEKGKPVLGICNGFQILTRAGLLPGELKRNMCVGNDFYCDYILCYINGMSFFGDESLLKKTLRIPIAHGYGRYSIDKEKYKEMKEKGQIFLKYFENPNGSYRNIAGVCNENGNVFGMMPHPERTDAQTQTLLIKSIEKYVA